MKIKLKVDQKIERGKKLEEQKNLEKEQKHLEAKNKLRGWIDANASEQVKLMRELGAGDWENAAINEYVNSSAPPGYTRELWERSDRAIVLNKPTLEQLMALHQLSKMEGYKFTEPELREHTIDAVHDDSGGIISEEKRYIALNCTVTDFFGDEHVVAKIIEGIE
jgi:hypothetical protein